jgi:hypothetical protein
MQIVADRVLKICSRAAVLVAVAGWCIIPAARASPAREHIVSVNAPTQFDFSLATVVLHGRVSRLRASVVGRPAHELVEVAAARSNDHLIFILVTNRVPRGTRARAPKLVRVRLSSHAPTTATFSQDANILLNGAPRQDCSILPDSPLGHPYLSGYQLEGLAGMPGRFGGPGVTRQLGLAEDVAHALDQACGDAADSQFARWVRREPPIPHP